MHIVNQMATKIYTIARWAMPHPSKKDQNLFITI